MKSKLLTYIFETLSAILIIAGIPLAVLIAV